MKFGLFLGSEYPARQPMTQRVSALVEQVRLASSLGFDCALGGPALPELPRPDPPTHAAPWPASGGGGRHVARHGHRPAAAPAPGRHR